MTTHPVADRALLKKVSYHAVIRYVQRVAGHQLPSTGDVGVDAILHADALGLTPDGVREIILTPQVRAAIKIAVPMIRTPDFTAYISECGVVTTIIPPESSAKKKRTRIRGRREGRRASISHARRKRSKTVRCH